MAEIALRPGAVAFVTGASSGIGEAIAVALVGRRLKVVAAARRRERLDELARRLGPSLLPFAFDVTDAAAAAALPDALPEGWREVDVLVCNAGHDLGGRRRFDRQAVADAAAVVETNLLGTLRVALALTPGMTARGRGHLVLVGSQAGVMTFAGDAAYIASKWGVHGLARALRADLQGSGVRVTEILPGAAKTGFAAARLRGDDAKAEEFYAAFKELLTPEDVARCALFALEQPAHVNVSELLVQPAAG
jgi:NADP-dependent 3-hydroxy acid dehydrogenase YdfG